MSIIEKNDAQLTQDILFFVRGYFIPVIGIAIIFIMIILIFIPSISGIFADLSKIQNDNDTYSSVKARIQYFKDNSSSEAQSNLTDNILAINSILPDQIKSADIVSAVQSTITQNGFSVVSASSELISPSDLSSLPGLTKIMSVSQLNFHLQGPSGKLQALFSDISAQKQLSYISQVSIQGNLDSSSQDSISLVLNVFSLDSNKLTKTTNLLTPFSTNYTVDKISKL